MRKPHLRIWTIILGIGAIIVLLACGSTNTVAANPTATATLVPTNAPTNTPAPTATPTIAPPINCGTVEYGTVSSPNPKAAEQCFAGAFQQCRQATLVVDYHGVDSETIDTLKVQVSGATCSIADKDENKVYSGSTPVDTITNTTCTTLTLQGSQYVVKGCGNGKTVTMP